MVEIQILPNPNLDYSSADFDEQQNLLVQIEDAIKGIHHAVSQMRRVQDQLKHYTTLLESNEALVSLYNQGVSIEKQLREWEIELIQPNQKTFQDVINFNNKLNAELMYLKDYVDAEDPKVTSGAKERFLDLNTTWKQHEARLNALIENEFKSFESNYRNLNAPLLKFDLDKN